MQTIEHRKTTTAALAASLLVLPASIIGYGLRWIAQGITLGLYAPGTLAPPLEIIFGVVLPNLIFGLATGMVAIGLAHLLFRTAELMTVAKVTSAVWLLIYATGLALEIVIRGWSIFIVEGAVLVVGLVVGSFVSAMDNSAPLYRDG